MESQQNTKQEEKKEPSVYPKQFLISADRARELKEEDLLHSNKINQFLKDSSNAQKVTFKRQASVSSNNHSH